jgi:hypothetical protein
MKLTALNKVILPKFRVEFEKDLEILSEKYGLNLEIGTISFDESSFKTQLKATLQSAVSDLDPGVRPEWQLDLKKIGSIYGLTPDVLAKEHPLRNGQMVKIVGLNTRARDGKPLIGKIIGKDGTYKFSFDSLGLMGMPQ